MQFLAPWMLVGVLTAAVPVVLHLLRRSKPVVVPWAAMSFLRKSMRETSRKIRFRDLLLLLCRMAVLILLALALSRPTLSSLPATGGIDAVLLVDVSQSMATQEGPSSRMEQAIRAANALLDRLPSGSSARLLTICDRAEEKALGQSGRFDSVRESMGLLTPTDRAGDFFPGFEAAIETLRASPLPRRQIYFFSDMQASGWQKQGGALRELAGKLPPALSIHLIRVGSSVPSNIQVTDLEPAAGVTFAGQRLPWLVRLRNLGEQPALDIDVHLALADNPDGGETVRLERLEGGEERIVPMDLLISASGRFPVEARAGNDRFLRDNKRLKVITSRDRVRVLVAEGKSASDSGRGNGFFLAHALRSSMGDSTSPRLEVKTLPAFQVGPEHLEEADLLFLVDPAISGPESIRPDLAERLPGWIKSGHGLAYFAGSRSVTGAAEGPHPLAAVLPGSPAPAVSGAKKSSHLDPRFQPGDWLQRFSSAPLDQISQAEFHTITPWSLPEDARDARVLARFTDGNPALILRSGGSGLVLQAPWVPDIECTNLPLMPTFVPLMQTLLARMLDSAEDPRNIAIEAPLTIQMEARDTEGLENFSWLDPEGVKRPARTRQEGDRIRFLAEFFTLRSGQWKLQAPGRDTREPAMVAVQSPISEGVELGGLQPGEIDELLGARVFHHQVGEETVENWASLGEVSGWILPLAGLLFIFEALFAWWNGKPL